MKNYKIANKDEVDTFMESVLEKDHCLHSIKGEPPDGAMYDSGEIILNPVNVAWVDSTTKEKVEILYEHL